MCRGPSPSASPDFDQEPRSCLVHSQHFAASEGAPFLSGWGEKPSYRNITRSEKGAVCWLLWQKCRKTKANIDRDSDSVFVSFYACQGHPFARNAVAIFISRANWAILVCCSGSGRSTPWPAFLGPHTQPATGVLSVRNASGSKITSKHCVQSS
jgi:hypothetical protein